MPLLAPVSPPGAGFTLTPARGTRLYTHTCTGQQASHGAWPLTCAHEGSALSYCLSDESFSGSSEWSCHGLALLAGPWAQPGEPPAPPGVGGSSALRTAVSPPVPGPHG